MRYSISNTAEYGDLTRGPRVITPETKKEMKKILSEIQSGQFVTEFMSDIKNGSKNFESLREKGKNHPIEAVGTQLRSMMPWI
jgi:ketol-acid reductoisomerase